MAKVSVAKRTLTRPRAKSNSTICSLGRCQRRQNLESCLADRPHLLDNWQEPSVVHTDTAREELPHVLDLRQVLVGACQGGPVRQILKSQVESRQVRTFESLETPFECDVDFALLSSGTQIGIRHAPGVLLAPLLAEDEHDDRQQLLLAQQADEVDPEVGVPRLVVPVERTSAGSSLSCHRASCSDLARRRPSAPIGATAASGSAASTAAASSTTHGRSETCRFSVLVLFPADSLVRFLVSDVYTTSQLSMLSPDLRR